MLEKIIKNLTQIESNLWDYQTEEKRDLDNVINTLKEINKVIDIIKNRKSKW